MPKLKLAGDGAAAVRPSASTLGGQDVFGHGNLLLAGCLVSGRGVLSAAIGSPGLRVELQAALVAVAGVDGPVAAGLALCDLVPLGVGGGAGGAGAQEGGAATEDCAG